MNRRALPGLIAAWLAFWIIVWYEPLSVYVSWVDVLPRAIVLATVGGLVTATVWPALLRVGDCWGWWRTRRFERRYDRLLARQQPKRWKRLVGWYLVLSGTSTMSGLMLAPKERLTERAVAGLLFAWGAWWVVSNPPPDGYWIANVWHGLTSRARAWLRRRRS